MTGTAVGNKLYAQSGWVSSGSVSIASIAASLIACCANGPWNLGWLGWEVAGTVDAEILDQAIGRSQLWNRSDRKLWVKVKVRRKSKKFAQVVEGS